MRFDGKIGLITGAGSGIGRATALGFAKGGGAVAVADVNESAANAVVAEITAAGGSPVCPSSHPAAMPDRPIVEPMDRSNTPAASGRTMLSAAMPRAAAAAVDALSHGANDYLMKPDAVVPSDESLSLLCAHLKSKIEACCPNDVAHPPARTTLSTL